ncbi:MAG: TA system VapC family ribonuclease toxin [Acidobacteriota bacterium]
MILLDANVLIYAYDSRSPFHEHAKSWLEMTFRSLTPVRLPWTNILAFLRITTNGRILEQPFTTEEALEIVGEWLALPNVSTVEPTERHFTLLRRAVEDGRVQGAMMMDAHLAALANEHGLTLFSADRDFARFDELSWRDPFRQADTVNENLPRAAPKFGDR